MAEHRVQVVQIGDIVPIPNADKLGAVRVAGFDVVVDRTQWKPGDLAVHVEPDYVVPDTPVFAAIVGTHRRIGVRKLRGVYSQGLLVPAAALGLGDVAPGTDVMERLGIVRYEPFPDTGEDAPPPPGMYARLPTYKVESWRSVMDTAAGEFFAFVEEKIHGESWRAVCVGGDMHMGSLTRWKRTSGKSSWAAMLATNPWIDAWCREHEGVCLYGEVFGHVPGMAYGRSNTDRGALAFNAMAGDRWLARDEFADVVPSERRVPVVAEGYTKDIDVFALAEGPTMVPGAKGAHVREGVVVKAAVGNGGTLRAYKLVGNGYFARRHA